jgi:uncharacterized membrane protein (UPF0127 family)
MSDFISFHIQLFSKSLIILIVCLASQAQFINHHWPSFDLTTPNGKDIEVSWAIKDHELTKGLSGLKQDKMRDDQGLLFYYPYESPKQFWMPNTLFDLDIIFLNSNFEVVGINANMKHYPKYGPEKKVPRTNIYHSQYVLEIKANQAKRLGIQKGIKLRWKKPLEASQFLNSLRIR